MDNQVILFTGTVFMGFFAIMNPVANGPIFIFLAGIDSLVPQSRCEGCHVQDLPGRTPLRGDQHL